LTIYKVALKEDKESSYFSFFTQRSVVVATEILQVFIGKRQASIKIICFRKRFENSS